MTLLRQAYYQNTTSIEEIQRANIAFESDSHLLDVILKTFILQTNANNNGCPGMIACNRKKSFLFRSKQLLVYNLRTIVKR